MLLDCLSKATGADGAREFESDARVETGSEYCGDG
jgi:hypothetical protein